MSVEKAVQQAQSLLAEKNLCLVHRQMIALLTDTSKSECDLTKYQPIVYNLSIEMIEFDYPPPAFVQVVDQLELERAINIIQILDLCLEKFLEDVRDKELVLKILFDNIVYYRFQPFCRYFVVIKYAYVF